MPINTYIMNYLFSEDGDINEVSDILIILLKFCIHYNKVPNHIGELPSFNKVSSDIISCLFLVSIHIYFS